MMMITAAAIGMFLVYGWVVVKVLQFMGVL